MSAATPLADAVRQYSCTKLRDSLGTISKCLKLLSVEQVWHRFNDVSNAIGNLVLHLNGNVRQWIVASLGGESFERDRPAEFNQREPLPTGEIFDQLSETVNRACEVIAGLSDDDLVKRFSIQGYDVSGAAAVIHVVEHFSLHTGQIVYATKILTNADLSQYGPQGRRLDGRESGVP